MRCEDGRKVKRLLPALRQRAGTGAHGASAGLGLFGAASVGQGLVLGALSAALECSLSVRQPERCLGGW